MRNSLSQFQHLLRVALVALPLLLGLNGRAVTLLRPLGSPTQSRVSTLPRATVIRQKVVLEAASPLGAYVAPAAALGWPPATLPAAWVPRRLRRAVAAPLVAPAAFVAQLCHQCQLGAAILAQAP